MTRCLTHLCVMGKKSTPRKFGVISASNISMMTGLAPRGFVTASVSSACGTSSHASWIARETERQLSGREILLLNLRVTTEKRMVRVLAIARFGHLAGNCLLLGQG